MTEPTAIDRTETQKAYNVAQSDMFQLAAYGHHRYHPLVESLTAEGKRQERDYNNRLRAAREELEAALLRLVAEHAEMFPGERGVAWLRSLADDPGALSLLAVRPDERDFDTEPAAVSAGVAPATEPTEPACKFEEGCHRVVACDPGCAVTTARMYARLAAASGDRAALREVIAAKLADEFSNGQTAHGMRVVFESPDGKSAAVRMATPLEAADAVLPVLPATVERADVLRTFVLWLDASDGSVLTHDGVQWPDGWVTIRHRHYGHTTTHHTPEAAAFSAHGKQGRIVWPAVEPRRVAAEARTTETDAPREPVQHTPGTAILCPDCRAKGHAVCVDAEARQDPTPDSLPCGCPSEAAAEHQFGTEDCSCIPFTRKHGAPSYCQPGDTVDDISGWERGRDCPHHKPAGGAPQPKEADGDRIVAYRSPLPGALSVYCTNHTDELGDGVMPLTSDDLPDGGLCAQCGADVLIPQQPKESRP